MKARCLSKMVYCFTINQSIVNNIYKRVPLSIVWTFYWFDFSCNTCCTNFGFGYEL